MWSAVVRFERRFNKDLGVVYSKIERDLQEKGKKEITIWIHDSYIQWTFFFFLLELESKDPGVSRDCSGGRALAYSIQVSSTS
jgi:hypothetical protein